MATVNTNGLRVQNAKGLVSSITGTKTYAFIGKPTAWASGDDTPPIPDNSLGEYYEVYNEMMSMVRVESTKVFHMILKLTWTSGAVYDMYRHDYSETNTSNSGAKNLYNCVFTVVNQNNNVYACLFNNNNAISTVEPQNTGTTPFYTSDGYQWLRLYDVTNTDFVNYTTTTFLPITSDEVTTTPEGAVYTAIIDTSGSNYTSSPAGVVNQIPHYFCNVVGDGTGAVAQVSVSDGEITNIVIVRNGQDYTYGALDFRANNVYGSLSDLDGAVNGLNPLGDGNFNSTVIISPPGGWGADLVSQLGGTRVGVFSDMDYDNNDFLGEVTFRQIGLLWNPTTVENNPETVSVYYGVSTTTLGGAADYTIGETIAQSVDTDAGSRIAKGTIVGWDSTDSIIRYIQDPKIHSDSDGNLYRFSGDGYITGATSGKITEPNLEYNEESGGQTFVLGYAQPEITKYTGELIYLTNKSPILRTPTQSEKVSIVISY